MVDHTYTGGSPDESASTPDRGPVVCVRTGRRLPQRLRKLVAVCLGSLLFVVLLGLSAGAIFWARLGSGPIYFESLAPKIASALAERIGNGFTVEVGPTIVGQGAQGPALGIDGLRVRSPTGQTVLLAPRAEISVEALGLMFGDIRPTKLDLIGLDVRLVVLKNGSFAVAAGSDPIVLAGPVSETQGNLATPEVPVIPESGAPPEFGAVAPSGHASAGPSEIRALVEGLRTLLNIATSPMGPAGALQSFEISSGRLVLDDQLRGQEATFDQLELEFTRTGETARLHIASNGSAGRWQATAVTSGGADGARDLSISLDDVALDDILALSGQREAPIDFDMPISLRFRLNLAADGSLLDANARLALGAGYIYFRDRDAEPQLIDELQSIAYWNPIQKKLVIENLRIESDSTLLSLTGLVAPLAGEEAWTISLAGGTDSAIGPDRPGDKPLLLPRIKLEGKVRSAARTFELQNLELGGPDVDLAFTGGIGWGESGPSVQINGQSGRMQARALIRLWPAFVAPPARGWFIDHLSSGIIEEGSIKIDFDAAALIAMQKGRPVPEASTLVAFRLSDATATFLPGVPPLSGIDGVGRITGKAATFNASKGALQIAPNRRLTLSEASFVVADLAPEASVAKITARASGPLDAVADILSREALKDFGGLPIDPRAAKGQVDGRLTLDLHLNQEANPGDPRIRVNATVSSFSLDKVIGAEKLDQGTLTVIVDRTTLKATGQGRMFGAPATMEIRRDGKGPTESTISVVLDDAARNKQGWPTGSAITGPVAARFTSDLARGEDARPEVEIDFTRATIDGLVPGYSKPAGKAAKASFRVTTHDNGAQLEQFAFDGGGGVMANGVLTLDSTGGFTGGKFSQVRLSPGDDMKVDVEQTKDTMRLVIRATNLDARPFTRKIASPEGGWGRDGAGSAKAVDLDLKAGLLTGNNRQTISGAEIRYAGRGGAISNFNIRGKLGNASLVGQMTPGASPGSSAISLSSNDGGALLSFIDLYRRMEGGALTLAAQVREGQVEGYLNVADFRVRDEPALRRLVTEGAPQRDAAGAINIAAAQFNKLQLNFIRTPTRLDLRDAVLNGPEIGLSADGMIDYGRDRVQIAGTFVPAYGLNNLFARIPLFGTIIGGGANEGLFAVTFQIAGKASAPLLTINPLSAIAPGIFRKIFGVGLPPAPEPAPQRAPAMPLSIAPAR